MNGFLTITFALLLHLTRSQFLGPPQQDIRELNPTSSFIKYYGRYLKDTSAFAKFGPSGDIFFAFSSEDAGTHSSLLVSRVGASGKLIWAKVLATAISSYVNNLQLASDGGILISGSVGPDGSRNMIVAKLQPTGMVDWSREIGAAGDDDIILTFKQTSDGNYILIGSSNKLNSSFLNVVVMKLNSSGNTLWTVGLNRSFLDLPLSVIETAQGDFLVTGWVGKAASQDFFITKISSSGTQLWLQTYGQSNSNDILYDLLPAQDSSHVYFAGYRQYTGTQKNAIFGEIDDSGNIVRCKEYTGAGNNEIFSMTYSASGTILVSGSATSFGEGGSDILIMEVDTQGNLISAHALGSAHQQLYTRIDYQQGYYLFGAQGFNPSQNKEKALIAKYSSLYSLCSELIFNRITSYVVSDFTVVTAVIAQSLAPITLQNNPVSLTSTDVTTTLNSYDGDPLCSLLSAIVIEDQSLNNSCRCSLKGVCNEVNSYCSCVDNYAGFYCQYPPSTSISDHTTTIQSHVSSVSLSYSGLTADSALLNDFKILTSLPDLVTPHSAIQILTLLSTKNADLLSDTEIELVFNLLSNFVEVLKIKDDASTTLASQLLGVLDLNLIKKIASTWSVPLPNISASILPFSSLSIAQMQLFDSLFLQLPSSLLNSHSSDVLTAVRFTRNIFLSVTPLTMRTATPVLSLNIYSGSSQLSISGVSPGFQMQLPLNRQIQPLASLLDEVFVTMSRTKQSVMAKGYFKCLFFNSTSKTLSSEGCSLVDLTATSVTCECSHMTSFAAFFDSGVDVISNSNYDVWLALSEITLQSLKSNLGFYIVMVWWGTLTVFGLLCCITDSLKMKNKFLLILAQSVESLFIKKAISNSKSLNISADSIHTTQIEREPKAKSSTRINPISQRNHREVTPDSTLFVDVKKSSSNRDSKTNMSSIAALIRARKSKRSNQSICFRIRHKMEISVQSENTGCCRRCLCCRSVKHELYSNNLLINLIIKTSALYSRCERLCIFYFGILLDITICALFFNLDPQETQDYRFWENIIENIWIAFYSVLLSIPFTFLLSIGFHHSPKLLSHLRQSKSVQELKQAYEEEKSKIRCWKCVGGSIFFFLSCLLSLYIIAFGEVAASSVEKNWMTSSGTSFMIDILIFELVPALFYGGIVSLVFGCDCRCWLCLVVTLELYRQFRNLAA